MHKREGMVYMLKAVLFDVGGTLHTQVMTEASTRRFRSLIREVLSQRGILSGIDDETLFSAISEGGKRYKKFTEEALTELDPDVIWQDYFLAPFDFDKALLSGLGEELSCIFDLEEKEIIPREGLHETVAALRARGYQLGIISNIMSRTMVGKVLERHGLTDAFSYVLQSSDCKIRKPDPRIFDLCLIDLGLTRDEVIYVGDTISRDVRGAKAAGWRIIQIDNPLTYHRDTAYRNMGYAPEYFIYALPEIIGIVDGLRQAEKGG